MPERRLQDKSRACVLTVDGCVRGALVVLTITFGMVVIFIQCISIAIAMIADNDTLRALGMPHQPDGVRNIMFLLVAIFNLVFIPFVFFSARAYARSYWKMALISSLLWVAQIVYATYKLPTSSTLPNNLLAMFLLAYLVIRWHQIKMQA